MSHRPAFTRRTALTLMVGTAVLPLASAWAAEDQVITVHKDPNCGCCTGWVQHLQKAGFTVRRLRRRISTRSRHDLAFQRI